MRTDLAKEAWLDSGRIKGVAEEVALEGEIEISSVTVTGKYASERLDKPKGRYVTLTTAAEAFSDAKCRAHLARCTAVQLCRLMQGSVGSVMTAGLGNRKVTPDALGPKTVEHVFVTRHILKHLPDMLPVGTREVTAFTPNVLGVTGMETAEVILGLIDVIRPEMVVIVDALASSDMTHIGRVVQMNDSGIAPGAGIGNFRKLISRESVGVPVIALGVPLVVSAQTIVREAVGPENLRGVSLGRIGDMIVTPKDIDALVADSAKLLSQALNLCLHGENYANLEALLE
ncbi:MAG TPA: GPR endopeptidase [Clostridia bacterium]|nr:GPR endopeptidase [Clostridia bacterium]